MASTFTGFSSSLDHSDTKQPSPTQTHLPGDNVVQHNNNTRQHHPITPAESHLLSPYSSAHALSSSTSPDTHSYTPDSSLSIYPTADFIPESDDQFYGASFNDVRVGNTPSFLGDEFLNLDDTDDTVPFPDIEPVQSSDSAEYLITPDKTPLIQSSAIFRNQGPAHSSTHISVFRPNFEESDGPAGQSVDSSLTAPQLTPDTNDGGWSGDENLVPYTSLAMISPRVTVSEWETGNRSQDASFTAAAPIESPLATRAPRSAAGDFAGNIDAYSFSSVSRNAHGSESSSSSGVRQGLAPETRPSDELTQSINQQATQREISDKNDGVADWVSRSRSASMDPSFVNTPAPFVGAHENSVPSAELPLGNQTENKYVDGQTYLNTAGVGPMDETDIRIMRERLPWESGPRIHEIQSDRTVPETANDAIRKLQQQWADNVSMVSRAATWGTRRRSLPGLADVEGVVSGNFLKKLSISGRDNSHARRPSLISRIPSLVRRTSTNQRKRRPSAANEQPPNDQDPSEGPERRESKDSLFPPSRVGSWGVNRKSVPSLNTALFDMAAGAASIGSQHHARNGSVSGATVTSPKNAFGGLSALSVPPVKNTLRRPRSRSDLPGGHTELPNALIGLLKAQGGPPAVLLAKTSTQPEREDDEEKEEDEEDEEDDTELDMSSQEEIIPTMDGFKQHIIRLNPDLANHNGQPNNNAWLVDRIAHFMLMRYKQLLSLKVKHLATVSKGICSSGDRCLSLGGVAKILDARNDTRGPESSDGDGPLDNLSNERFPAGIPMPPTTSLPAEFECQLCFTSKKFNKPSDWTKHVHEDVQPFTCTWDKCRDPKMFKRKADWVRHENEGHRHLEWWTCDVEDCRHICYRRDNFLQHLVREHKFTEPKVKTKAQIKKAGGSDQTWLKVEACHTETNVKPCEEECRFCGKTFQTWKKLTVHLAKHMENISLPVLRLVEAKDLEPDTIISPIQDPPPTNFRSMMSPSAQAQIKQEPRGFDVGGSFMPANSGPVPHQQQGGFGMGMMSQSTYSQPMDASFYPSMPPNPDPGLLLAQVSNGMGQPQYHGPVTNGPQFTGFADPYMNMGAPTMEAFPVLQPDSLGIHGATGPPMGYGNVMSDPPMQAMHQHVEQYSNQGSASPYTRSPHQGHSQYY